MYGKVKGTFINIWWLGVISKPLAYQLLHTSNKKFVNNEEDLNVTFNLHIQLFLKQPLIYILDCDKTKVNVWLIKSCQHCFKKFENLILIGMKKSLKKPGKDLIFQSEWSLETGFIIFTTTWIFEPKLDCIIAYKW